jgi:hypothetical protein
VDGTCNAHVGDENAYKILVLKSQTKRPLERHGPRCEDNTEMYVRKIEFSDVEWLHLAQDMNQ